MNIKELENTTIIEEKIGETNISFSAVLELYKERVVSNGEEVLFRKTDTIALNQIEKNKFRIDEAMNDLFYNEEIVYMPIFVIFEKDKNKKIYKVFTQTFLNKIYKEFNFLNPVLSIGNSYEKFDISDSSLFTGPKIGNIRIYKIIEFETKSYDGYYKNKVKYMKECDREDLTPNFRYYFKSPTKVKMKFSMSLIRRELIFSLLDFKKKKIRCIFGPYGNGKSTSLIILSRNNDGICYFNLKALYNNKNNLYLWKSDLFLLELFNLFKKNKNPELFNSLKIKIFASNHFWESIKISIEFCIENKIKSIFILDQYKEELDPSFMYIEIIKQIINKESNTFVNIILSSSINNSDIRNFIINKYIHKFIEFINDYKYISTIFQLIDISGLLDKLTGNKRRIFEEYFSNIPSYFYMIYESNEDEINNTVKNIKTSIKSQMEKFFEKIKLSHDDLCFIIENYPLIGTYLNKDNNKVIPKEKLTKLIQILPIKYFFLKIENDEIKNIQFYFKLAKISLLEIIMGRILKFLNQPKLKFPERVIGDLLELIVLENLKNNELDKFNQICNVNSILEMKYINGLDNNKVNEDNILIIEEDESAKFIDFGILLKGKILVLVQCKKDILEIPKKYVKISDIILKKNILFDLFKKHFNCDIEKIKLIYLTGIAFIDEKKNEYLTWSQKEHDFEILEGITKADNIPLLFFDISNKKLLVKNGEAQFDSCEFTNEKSVIYDENNYAYVNMQPDKNDYIKIIKGIRNQIEFQERNFFDNLKTEKKTENKIDKSIYEEYLNKDIICDKTIIVDKPNILCLLNNNEDVLTTFKIKGNKYFSYYDNINKKMQYKEIKNGSVKDCDLKLEDTKIYFLNKKISRETKQENKNEKATIKPKTKNKNPVNYKKGTVSKNK